MTTHGSWLKTREIYPLTIPEARLPPKAPGESLLPAPPSFWGWPAFLGLWMGHSDLCLCHHVTAFLRVGVGVEISLFS